MWNDNPFNRIGRCEGLVAKINVYQSSLRYGKPLPLVMYECKNKNAISWQKLAEDQLWEQADFHKNGDGKLWVIGQIGFEICVYKFDVLNSFNREEFLFFKFK